MKINNPLLIFLFLTSLNLLAKQDTLVKAKLKCGINIAAYRIASSRQIAYSIDATIENKKHLLYLGPLFSPNIYLGKSNDLDGFHVAYAIFPNGKGKTFDFYFLAETLYNKYKWEQRSNLKVISGTVNFGFRVNIYKGFYMNTNIGVGHCFKKSTEIIKGESYSNGYYDQTEILGKFGIGYLF